MTPYEAWTGRKPTVNHLKVFGSVAYVLINSQERKKLDDKSLKCILSVIALRAKHIDYTILTLKKRLLVEMLFLMKMEDGNGVMKLNNIKIRDMFLNSKKKNMHQ